MTTKTNGKLTLKAPGDKGFSTRMEWLVHGTDYTIVRRANGNVNASSAMRRHVEWTVIDAHGNSMRIPGTVRKHEAAIARWLLGV